MFAFVFFILQHFFLLNIFKHLILRVSDDSYWLRSHSHDFTVYKNYPLVWRESLLATSTMNTLYRTKDCFLVINTRLWLVPRCTNQWYIFFLSLPCATVWVLLNGLLAFLFSLFCVIRKFHRFLHRLCAEDSETIPNRPVSYSNGWTGSSMRWRLMRAN